MKKKFHPWSKLPCSRCGVKSLATRTEYAEIDTDTFLCDDCETYQKGYKDGYEAGVSAAFNKHQEGLEAGKVAAEIDVDNSDDNFSDNLCKVLNEMEIPKTPGIRRPNK